MPTPSVNQDETDVLFSTDPEWLSARFGARAYRQMCDGGDPFVAARLAATYAFMHRPDLRGERPKGQFSDTMFQIASGLNALYADALKRVH